MMKFRTKVICYLLLALAPTLTIPALAGDNAFTRQVMLRAMAQNCIVPGVVELATNADEIFYAVHELKDKPCPQTLAKVRVLWMQMQTSYRHQRMLCYGPIENQAFWQANFYRQTYPSLVEVVVRGSYPINQDLIERAGAPVKGFTTMEYFLFAPSAVQTASAEIDENSQTNLFTSWLLQGKTALRRRQYLYEIASDLDKQLQQASKKAQDPNFPAKFAAGGQDSINLLVNQLSVTLESDLTLPLEKSLVSRQKKELSNDSTNSPPRTLSNQEEGALSGTTISGMKATLEGLDRFYHGTTGTGLNIYLQRVNPSLDDRIEGQFKATAAAMSLLDKPLDQLDVTQQPTVKQAFDETHKLEILFKVDLVSSLGMTIMFNAYDGD
jgi:uncharacterized protein